MRTCTGLYVVQKREAKVKNTNTKYEFDGYFSVLNNSDYNT